MHLSETMAAPGNARRWPGPPPKGASGDSPDTRLPRPRTVLYIEDEALNVLLMEEVFRSRQDWQLSIARDGEQGLAMAIAEQPDLLLIDLNLPGINGTEVLRRLKRSHPALAERAVMLSANVMPEQINAALAAGFRAYWTKPIHLSALIESIGQMLADGAAIAPPSEHPTDD